MRVPLGPSPAIRRARHWTGTSGCDLSDYRPISYTLRNLGDNSIAKMSETTEYDITECTAVPAPAADKIGERVVVLVDSLEIQSDCNDQGNGTYDVDITLDDTPVIEIDGESYGSPGWRWRCREPST